MILFADDTNVFVQGKNINKMFNIMNGELQKLAEWMCINKLSLNVKKTEYMIFSLKRISVSEKQIVLNGIPIERVKMFKFLGVLIDEHLTWDQHVLFIKNKIAKGLGVLYKAKCLLNATTLLTLYYSFIYPYLIDCVEVWGSTSKKNLLSLLALQKRAVRLILSVSTRTESAPLFMSLNVLPIFDIYICIKFHYWCIKQLIAKYLNQSLTCLHWIQKCIHDVPDNPQSTMYLAAN